MEKRYLCIRFQVPLWPKTDSSKLLRVKCKGDMHLSSPFRFNEVQCCLMRFNNKVFTGILKTVGLKLIGKFHFSFQYGGINVDVQVTEGGIYITFMEYHAGDAPALMINHTDHAISFWEKGNVNERYSTRLRFFLDFFFYKTFNDQITETIRENALYLG